MILIKRKKWKGWKGCLMIIYEQSKYINILSYATNNNHSIPIIILKSIMNSLIYLIQFCVRI